MTRSVRILVAAGALLLLVVATALAAPSDRGRNRMAPVAASHQASPGAEGRTADRDEGPPSAEHLQRLVTLLGDAGVSTDAATIEALAARYGVGGAVRLLTWSEESGLSTDELAAMFDSGIGWGEMAHELNDANGTSLHPGLGPIMSGNGQGVGAGREHAPGQQKKAD
jgi:hypothetical protein